MIKGVGRFAIKGDPPLRLTHISIHPRVQCSEEPMLQNYDGRKTNGKSSIAVWVEMQQ